MEYKITSFETIIRKTDELKKEGKRIVLCHGLFHFLHIGHIRYLREAKEYGDVLFVSVIADQFIGGDEGVDIDEMSRCEALAAFEFVEAVFLSPFEDVYELLKHVKPNVFAQGSEAIVKRKEKKWDLVSKSIEELGVERIILEGSSFASTQQINKYLANMPKDTRKYLQYFKQRFGYSDILQVIEDMSKLRVLVIGDTILDEYHYCSAIGKSSKDPTLALKYESQDMFAGGVLAVANHAAKFASSVELITILGEKESYEGFIRSSLSEKVRPYFLFKSNAPTLIKRRFIDGYSMNKLLEIYIMDESVLNGKLETSLIELVRAKLAECDMVIVADFGHGAINTQLKKLLSKKAPFLAVNAQSNAGNRGFNNITKYPRVDYISMAEHEIRLEMRDPEGSIREMMSSLVKKMGCRNLVVTRGSKGCMVMSQNFDFVQVPSFAQRVVDRVGAGDAFFAFTSLAAVQDGASFELIGFLGNIAGSIAVEVMGNEKFIDKDSVVKLIQNLSQ